MSQFDEDDFPTLPLEGDHLSRVVLEAYRSGHLSPDERLRIAPHVDACQLCQARLDQPDSLLAEVVRACRRRPFPKSPSTNTSWTTMAFRSSWAAAGWVSSFWPAIPVCLAIRCGP